LDDRFRIEEPAIKAGFYETEYGKFPKIQVLTIGELFAGRQPELPWRDTAAFRKAARETTSKQDSLPL
jgi:site-specific DNA-methyltransferase (adenine-specific)